MCLRTLLERIFSDASHSSQKWDFLGRFCLFICCFDVTHCNHENVVIKIALLDYSDSESRQWLSQCCQLYGEEEGAGSRVARIRNMDMKGRKETVKWIIPPSQNLIILFYGRRVSPIGWKRPHWEVRTTRGDSFIIKWKVNLQRHCHDHQLFISRFNNIGALCRAAARWPKSAALR